ASRLPLKGVGKPRGAFALSLLRGPGGFGDARPDASPGVIADRGTDRRLPPRADGLIGVLAVREHGYVGIVPGHVLVAVAVLTDPKRELSRFDVVLLALVRTVRQQREVSGVRTLVHGEGAYGPAHRLARTPIRPVFSGAQLKQLVTPTPALARQ